MQIEEDPLVGAHIWWVVTPDEDVYPEEVDHLEGEVRMGLVLLEDDGSILRSWQAGRRQRFSLDDPVHEFE
eukprot:9982076-Karenia_brevis.AAC.1